ncbi:aspartyl-phosphate phosphatase Spo0E family protein [Paenibacillus sp. FSL W8-0186]|uniref:Aspartyl-phosphate phosphatase Spo0E family protein n=1 Tax=Paenibacillus woosongensis TaxID=307580 RepID=A0ABQ4MV91_9BACL|nr:aspartyl-phosphate phosphatase Spo0E family protein [Paenibacillus woosongensis]GIP59848.1 hypothetical protein J15TS10_36620 [Paenibacillus woosongensis]
MKEWTELFEVEKQKLNQLGNESLADGIPFHENDALQDQSRRVDELIIQLHKRAGFKRRSR